MSGFAFSVACLRLVANEPLFGIYVVPLDWPELRQNLRIAEVHMVFCFKDMKGYSLVVFSGVSCRDERYSDTFLIERFSYEIFGTYEISLMKFLVRKGCRLLTSNYVPMAVGF